MALQLGSLCRILYIIEGLIQVNLVSMVFYDISLLPVEYAIQYGDPDTIQTWYADDAVVMGTTQ